MAHPTVSAPASGSSSVPLPVLRPGLVPRRWSAHSVALDSAGRRCVRDRPGLVTVLRALEARHSREQLDRLIESLGWDEPLDVLLSELDALDAIKRPRRRARIQLAHDRQSAEFARVLHMVAGDRCDLEPFPQDTEDVVVIVSASEPSREPFRTLVAARVPHLLVVFDAELIHVGPFVIPGVSPCIECFDQHQSRWNPSWPAVIAQAGGPPPLRIGAEQTVQTSAALTVASWLTAETPTGLRMTIGPAQHPDAPVQFQADASCHCSLLSPIA